jgi:hypothetical protein
MNTDPGRRFTDARHLIPGAYERNTLTHRQLGSMGGPAFGSANVLIGSGSMDAATIADREMEGGGALSQRRRNAGRTGAQCSDWLTRGPLWLQLLRLSRR